MTVLTFERSLFTQFMSIILQRSTFQDNEMTSKDLLDAFIFPYPNSAQKLEYII